MTTLLLRYLRQVFGLPTLPICLWCQRPGTATVEMYGDCYCRECVRAANY